MLKTALRPKGIKRKPRKAKILRAGGIKRPLAKSSGRIKPSLLKKADNGFSGRIKARDKHCQFPGCTKTTTLTCSHYIGRAVKSTRFDEDNCVALCLFHHFFSKDLGFEFQKQTIEKHGYDGQYTIWMKKNLGEERWNALILRAKKKVKLKDAIEDFMHRTSLVSHKE